MWQHAGVPSDMCGAGPCLWESMEPTLQLRDSTNARLELSLTKMADGAHQEWPHQHHLWRSGHWPTEEPHTHTPFWAATLQLRDSTNARLDPEEPHIHTPFWAATLQLRDSTNARLDLSLTKNGWWCSLRVAPSTPLLKELTLTYRGAACQHYLFEQHHWWFIHRQKLKATANTSQIHKCIKQNWQCTMTH